MKRITWNVVLTNLSKLAGADINFHPGTPLGAAITTTKLAWSTAKLKCDLYLPSPISSLVADKLHESLSSASKPQVVLENLKDVVEFPDVRSLVNAGHLSLAEVLSIRRKASRFRRWLQTEGDRDRDAIIAYHHEVARQTGLEGATRKTISLVSTVASGAVGGAVGAAYAGPVGGAVGGAVASGVGLLGEMASRLNADWRPVVFGRWLEDRLRTKGP